MSSICLLSPNLDPSRLVDARKLLPQELDLIGVGYSVPSYTDDEFGRLEATILKAAAKTTESDCSLLVITGELFQAHLGHVKTAALTEKIACIAQCDTAAITLSIAAAFAELNVKRIVVASPFSADQTEILAKFLKQEGLEILATSSLGCKNSDEVWQLSPDTGYEAASRLLRDYPTAEAVYMPNNQWRITSAIARLEADFGKPVIANTPAWIKSALRRMGADRPIPGYGRLLNA